MKGKAKQIGCNQNREGDSVLFNSLVKQFVISTIDMVKSNMSEEQTVIDQMLLILNNKMVTMHNTPTSTARKQLKINHNDQLELHKIQSAVEQLNKQSDNMSQRLFDLSQTLIQNKINQMELQKQYLQRSYQNKLLKIKHNFDNQKRALQSQLNHYKQKCSILQDCLSQKEQYILKQSKRLDQGRKLQLNKYLQVIESIYQQLQQIKNFSPSPTYNQTDSIDYYSPPHKYDNYSEQYYGYRRDQQETQAQTYYHRNRFNHQHYGPSKQRSNSKNNNLQLKYSAQIPLPSKHYYVHNTRTERSQSTDKQQPQQFNAKVRPIIIQYQAQPEIKPILKQSQMSRKRSLREQSDNQQKRIEDKNQRMQSVQQKLHGLKRQLSRQLINMKK